MNAGNVQTKSDVVDMSVASLVKSSSFTCGVELVNKMPPMSVYGSVAVNNRHFSVTSAVQSRGRTSFGFPPNADYLSHRRLSHNRISAM